MKIKVRGIPQEGLTITRSVEPSELGLTEEELNCDVPLEIEAKAERIQNVVSVQVEVRMQLAFSCARCLEDVEREFQEELKFDYPIDANTEFIDLGEDIRQEIILGLPTKVLCRDDCRGICMHCGANLNEEECRCSK